jgi:hypothetical protein
MSSTSAPFGLRPVYSPSGVVRPTAYSIDPTYSSTIYQNQPVKLVDGNLEAAGAGDRFIGTFQGVEWTDSDGRRRVSNKWVAQANATEIVAYATLDPSIVYEIQSNAAMTAADIGGQYDFTAASGNTTTGLSSQMLGVSTLANNAGLRVIGITPGANNAWGDNYVIVQVQISEHQNVADVADY